MKKLFAFSVFIGVLSVLTAHSVQADTLYRVQLDEVMSRRSVTIFHPETGEPYLLHLESGCGELTEGQNVSVSIRGSLNSNGDILKVDATHQCAIDQTERYTQKYYVKFVFSGNTEAWVIDESGEEYFMGYLPFCQAMPRYSEDRIYILQGSSSGLAKGDKIYLPNKDGQCSVGYVRRPPYFESREEEPDEETGEDIKIPTTVTHVRASAGNGKVHLSWRTARDNAGIDHYIVSYHDAHLTPKNIPVRNMPNQARTQNTYATIDGLQNNETYFFWVMAVDTSGNMSDNWSEEVRATPKASVLSYDLPAAGENTLNLRVYEETSRSFLIRWDAVPDVNRYTVVLETGSEREFAMTGILKKHIRILKRSHREGKPLTLTVRAYGLRSFLKEEHIEFGF